MHARTHTHIHTLTHSLTTHKHIHVHARTNARTNSRTNAHIHTHSHTRAHIHARTHTLTHARAHTHTHTLHCPVSPSFVTQNRSDTPDDLFEFCRMHEKFLSYNVHYHTVIVGTVTWPKPQLIWLSARLICRLPGLCLGWYDLLLPRS